jgi:unsaturated rhamnogalacturonyl hydrolase
MRPDDLDDGELHGKIGLLIENLCSIRDETGEYLQHLPDGRIVDTKSWDTDTWDWTHGIGLYGMWKYFILTRDSTVKERVISWFEKRFASGVKVDKNINTMSPFLALACLYDEIPDQRYLPMLEDWAQWAMRDLRRTRYGGMQHDTYQGPNPGQLWDDTLMMTVLPLTKIAILLKKPSRIREAKHQFLLHIKYLFDASTGAFFHGWTFNGHHNFAQARWARGNSWFTIVIPDFVELLDDAESELGGWVSQDPIRQHLLDTLEAQLDFLASCQDSGRGMWHTLLDHSDEGSYLESSATAGFAYGTLKAIRLKLCPPSKVETYRAMAEGAVRATLANIDTDGELQRTSFGTAMGDDLDFYRRIPVTSMPYGQAMAIMALGEYLYLPSRDRLA